MSRLILRSRCRVAVSLWLTVSIVTPWAMARTRGPGPQLHKRSLADQEVSTQLVKEAQKALGEQNLVEAQRLLTDAYIKWPSPNILYHLGVVASREGRLLDAHDLLRRYESDPASAPDAEMKAEMQRLLSKQRPPSGKVLVLGDDGAIVRVDGRVVGSLPLVQPLLISPGDRKSVV